MSEWLLHTGPPADGASRGQPEARGSAVRWRPMLDTSHVPCRNSCFYRTWKRSTLEAVWMEFGKREWRECRRGREAPAWQGGGHVLQRRGPGLCAPGKRTWAPGKRTWALHSREEDLGCAQALHNSLLMLLLFTGALNNLKFY